MRLVLQRAKNGSVTVDNQVVGKIDSGLVVLVGFGADDALDLAGSKTWQTMLQKMLDLRIFPDANDKMNLSLRDYGGEVLLVSQFTLYADCRKGRRPSFTTACPPDVAEELFNRFVSDVRKELPDRAERVQTGQFGAMMDVSLTNWGPVTITLSRDMFE